MENFPRIFTVEILLDVGWRITKEGTGPVAAAEEIRKN